MLTDLSIWFASPVWVLLHGTVDDESILTLALHPTWHSPCCHATSQLDPGEVSHIRIHLTTDCDLTQLNTSPHIVSSIIVSWKNSNYYTTFSVSKGVIQRKKESQSSVTSSPNDKQIDPALWLWESKQG